MGGGSFDPKSYAAFSATTRGKTVDEVYSSRGLDPSLSPLGVKVRESRDSADNPNSTPLIVALDVTGSMGMIADVIARTGLGVLFNEILDSKPIVDPHLMFMGVGDAHHDRAPLQVSQFEADNRIVEQLTKLWLEHGGGGNCSESYNLPWYFAAAHTVLDSMIKRGKRGYLFTVGDEEAPAAVTKAQIKTIIGDDLERDLSSLEMLEMAKRSYDVFHIIIEEGDWARQRPGPVFDSWTKLLGQNVVKLADHTKLAETIVSIIEVREGRDTSKLGTKYGTVVEEAVRHLPAGRKPALLGA